MYQFDGNVLNWSEDKVLLDLHRLECSTDVKEFIFIQCAIKSIEGIEKFPALQSVHLWHHRSLADISALEHCADTLRAFSIEACPKITDFSVLYKLKNLEHLNLMGNNCLPDLKFLDCMPNLKTFVFSMPVSDCDLTPCLRLPYASYTRGKRGYNLKDKDLPHRLPTVPFTLK